jgi:hypothetical protein
MGPNGCWPAAYAGHVARSIEPAVAGDGVTEGAVDGEAAAVGFAVARLEALGAAAVDPDGLPHAATNRTATNADRCSAPLASVIAGAMFPCCGDDRPAEASESSAPMRPICIVAFCAPRLRITDARAPVLGGSSQLGHLATESLAVPGGSAIQPAIER